MSVVAVDGDLRWIRWRLDRLGEARTHGWSPAEESEYYDLIVREVELLDLRDSRCALDEHPQRDSNPCRHLERVVS